MQKMVLLWHITQRLEIKELLRFDVEIRLRTDDCWGLRPFVAGFRLPARFGGLSRRAGCAMNACWFDCQQVVVNICRPSGAGFRPPAKFGTPARRAASRS